MFLPAFSPSMMSINLLEEELKDLKEVRNLLTINEYLLAAWDDRIRALEDEIFERQVLVNPETINV